ncbi:hypothetical protein I3271_09300 [Photobacterium leiognathi]|uniref:hypothetical protein n=1 Tax=Photobacterium leiognathi TaxID=553611 RepID=UPI001EDFE200|nr:hypothetical protein [Photobacterium leiognathi]MCG3884884.1 hypothetical protein [Photobacterium leiognathi]
MDFIATNDPDELSKYKKWLKDNNLPNNEKSYLQYLETQTPELMNEYKNGSKKTG